MNCNTLTRNPKFCNRRCSASYNNTIQPKRKKLNSRCASCGNPNTRQRKYCKTCYFNLLKTNTNWDKVTIGQLKSNGSANFKSRYSYIRALAVKVYAAANKPLECKHCGYAVHVEICHIKAISSFDLDTPVSKVNDISNLVALCRNHHWELDNGHLTLQK
jgi:hypothetical protein